ncbi:A/G-specific DNA-adenine glycosylase [Desulfuromusa kysingii]|uniref:Adenine DNA glycosylase n=1 Tax=Desulfuromusa kysingii TaxID=37625 RepID=A0A1H3VG90_9BACT|nr:A/G-specific adenine glycosylase [Desulfuromusa kysingii]SDZ73681.1 A/G-specific DNA-adenine glycosylase [Desulfuromusa kysingii]
MNSTELPFRPTDFSQQLLAWYGQSGRNLPWRNTRDPYRIWLSEIMLQQTTVSAVIDYYQRFLEKFPTVETLAATSLEHVIDLWAGLGYYSRARNLHTAAKMVVEQFHGRFPEDVESLQQLPGVGRSTAGAISALAFDQRAAILDGNVRRVLCRLFALQEPPRSSQAEKQLWRWSEQLTPAEQVHDYTQAIMDLGAMICVPRNPLCHQCPAVGICQAHKLELAQSLPLKGASKKIPTRYEIALLINHQDRYLLRRRIITGFLGGMWEFPTLSMTAEEDPEKKLQLLLSDFALTGAATKLGSIEHVYSHFRLHSDAYHIKIDNFSHLSEGENCWFPLHELPTIALHGAHKKILAKRLQHGD